MTDVKPRDWGVQNFRRTNGNARATSLVDAITPLSPRAKQAMYAAAEKNLIVRRSWNGCAWNMAGQEVGAEVKSAYAAHDVFGDSSSLVTRFIHYWDNMHGTDEECTAKLREALLEVGLTSQPEIKGNDKSLRRSVTLVLHESEETKFKKEFEEIMEDMDLPEWNDNQKALDLQVDVHQVLELLNA